MDNLTFGEVNWDSADTSSGSNTPRIPFLIMKEPGEYNIRIVSKPFQYYHHWVSDISGVQRKVNCTANEATCPVCKTGTKESKAKAHWLFKIIDRDDSAKEKKVVVKVLDCGSQISNAIADYNKNKTWGPVSGYDLTIKRGPKGRNPLYTVSPNPKQPLTEEEKNAVRATMDAESAVYIDLKKIGNPWTPEKINAVINGTPGGVPVGNSSQTRKSSDFDELDALGTEEASASPAPAASAVAAPKKNTPKESTQSDEDFLDL